MSKLEKRSDRAVAIWLYIGVGMIIVQIILGGITRLTDSGLSITEWKPVLGTIPPLNDKEWNEAFDHYKKIAQFKHIHYYFTLSDFKSIFFWEWMHRLWGRLIGLVFFFPFIVFLIQKKFRKDMVQPLVILFLLGGLQGLVGWIMVMSGLNEEDLYVSHIRLTIHFIAALILLVYTLWFALKLSVPPSDRLYNRKGKNWIMFLLAVLLLQLIYGGFMAGLKAAAVAPTWPLINGSYLPGQVFDYAGRHFSFSSSLVNNPVMVHFIHRNLAYLLYAMIIAWTVFSLRIRGSRLFAVSRWLPLFFGTIQVVLGITTVLTSPSKKPQQWGVFEWNAQLHQFVALLLLSSLIICYYLLTLKEKANSSFVLDAERI
jgi:cytochrome c oxidase assembly protein subunit 15